MPKEGNGQPIVFKVSFSGALAQELKKLHKRAKSAGLGDAYLEALRVAVFRMKNDPWGFGELIGRMKNSPWSIHVRVIKPLLFEFGIHEEEPIVFIRRVQLMI